jgi:hypothetical protein
MHAILLLSRNLTAHHREELLEVFDIEELLIVALCLGSLGVELVLGQERIDELPICTVRGLHLSDRTDFFEESLRIKELTLGSDVIEISVLDDAFEMCVRLREEDSGHDDILDLVDALSRMTLFCEPLAGDLCSDVFVFLILYCESCVMEEACELEILDIISLDTLSHSEIGRPVEYSTSMIRIVIWVCLACFEEEVGIHAGRVEEGSRHRMIQD